MCGIAGIISRNGEREIGSEMTRMLQSMKHRGPDSTGYALFGLPTDDYVRLMRKTACLVGNSSSAIREGSFIGTPAVNVGPRQEGRQRGSNVVDVRYDRGEIAEAVRAQVEHGPYEHEPIYGDGRAGERIADVLANGEFPIVKRMTY